METPAIDESGVVGCCRLLRALGCCCVGEVVTLVERNSDVVPRAVGGVDMVGVESLHVPWPKMSWRRSLGPSKELR